MAWREILHGVAKENARRGPAAPGVALYRANRRDWPLLADHRGRDGAVLVLGVDLGGANHRLDALEARQALLGEVAVHLGGVAVRDPRVVEPIELFVRHAQV